MVVLRNRSCVGMLGVLLVLACCGVGSLALAQAPVWSNLRVVNNNAGDDAAPRVATDGFGTWVAVWAAAGIYDSDWDIFYSRSTDNGATWSDAALLNSAGDGDSGDDVTPAIATDGAGKWMVVWASTASPGLSSLDSDWDIMAAASEDGGLTWGNWQQVDSGADDDTGDDRDPAIATDANGTWVIVWASTESGSGGFGYDRDILFSRRTEVMSSWTLPDKVNSNAATDTGDDYTPRIATDGSRWIVVWSSSDSLNGTIGADRDILYARAASSGLLWSTVSEIHSNAGTDSGDDFDPDIVATGAGTWLVVWSSTEDLHSTADTDRDIFCVRSLTNGLSWGSVDTINHNATTDTGDDTTPAIAYGGGENWLVVWSSTDPLSTLESDADVFYSLSTNDAWTWGNAAALNQYAATDDADDNTPTIASNRRGSYVVLWTSTNDLGNTVGTDVDIFGATGVAESTVAAFGDLQETFFTSSATFYGVVYRFGGVSASASVNGSLSGSVTWELIAGQWYGVYVYDYATADWEEAQYVYKESLD